MVRLKYIFKGIRWILSKDVFVSHRGHNRKNCGNLTKPCFSVRYAVKISSANDFIRIDYD